jgi:signal transduction histidine kinase
VTVQGVAGRAKKWGLLERLLSLGYSDAVPDRLSRQLRVTNALVLVGVVLSVTGIPIDAYGSPLFVLVMDVVALAAFTVCWVLSAGGYRTAARVMLLFVGNGTILTSVMEVSSLPGTRAVFFPLVLLPFLVFSISERGWLVLFVVVPIVGYIVTGVVGAPPAKSEYIYEIYSPVLAFMMLITGSAVFAYVERSADEKLVQARARSAHAAHLVALGEMASGIAHEIRNPLAAIHLAATEIATHPENKDQVAQLGERIQRIVMRAARIIETLRSLARDASDDPFVIAPVERILSDTLELCAKRIAEHGIELTVASVPPDLTVECRPVQLSQVLMNLIGNAYDAVAAADTRWVKIEVGGDEAHVEMSVTDSGAGIPEVARARVFEPFFTTKSPERGTGLGLSLSAGLVEAHHGVLELDAASEHTRFVLRIPRVQPRVPAAPAT